MPPGMSPNTLKDYEMTENAKESSNCEATTGAAGAKTTDVAAEGEMRGQNSRGWRERGCDVWQPLATCLIVVVMWTMCHLLLRTISYQSMRSMHAKRNGQRDSIPFRLASGLPSHRGQRMKLKMKFGIWALNRSLAQLQFFAAEVRYRRVRDGSAGHTNLVLWLPDTAFKNKQTLSPGDVYPDNRTGESNTAVNVLQVRVNLD